MKTTNLPMSLENDIKHFPTEYEERVRWHGLANLILGEEPGNPMFLLAVLSRFKISCFIYRDLKTSVFSKRGKIWPYFMELEGEREQERSFPSGCTDEILLCGAHTYSW